jgi:hypothetical protein
MMCVMKCVRSNDFKLSCTLNPRFSLCCEALLPAIEPKKGFLCLESEGSPIQFRKLRVRELP